MPKILIKEFDKTSAGAPSNYANYTVLITGYADSTKADAQTAAQDANGVFEFKSAGDFNDIIGLVDSTNVGTGSNQKTEYHYGNRMAYELLNMGYTVLYKIITKIADMKEDSFWAPFYDKASYDFRFVSHGLLETNCDLTTYAAAMARLNEIQADIVALFGNGKTGAEKVAGLLENAEIAYNTAYGDGTFDALPTTHADDGKETNDEPVSQTDVYMRAYAESTHAGFYKTGTTKYTYAEAKENLTRNATTGKAPAEAAQEAIIATHNALHVTPEAFDTINSQIAKLAAYTTDSNGNVINNGRGDCIALIELYEGAYVNTSSTDRPEALIAQGINSMPLAVTNNGAYCAMTVPSVYYKASGNTTKKFPGAFHYLACFMNSLRSGFSEWYAAAGYTRGICGYSIDHTSVKLGEIAINALEPRNITDATTQPKFACNVIANFRGSYYLWGNRTAAMLNNANGTKSDLTAEHFLNIRQLSTTLKKQIYVACRRFTFDPNSDTLWFNFVNAVTPTLDAMKADQGIRDYKILKVVESNPKKATMKAKIRVIPIEAVEDFDIEVSLEDSFGEVSVNAN